MPDRDKVVNLPSFQQAVLTASCHKVPCTSKLKERKNVSHMNFKSFTFFFGAFINEADDLKAP